MWNTVPQIQKAKYSSEIYARLLLLYVLLQHLSKHLSCSKRKHSRKICSLSTQIQERPSSFHTLTPIYGLTQMAEIVKFCLHWLAVHLHFVWEQSLKVTPVYMCISFMFSFLLFKLPKGRALLLFCLMYKYMTRGTFFLWGTGKFITPCSLFPPSRCCFSIFRNHLKDERNAHKGSSVTSVSQQWGP